MGNIGNGVINTFVDGDIVSASGTAPALLRSALNPKMQIIQAAVDDNDTRIGILEGQVTAITGSVQYNVKAAPFNAVGNGIADDTAAIQAAITQAVANQGVVVFPTGTYKITDLLTVAGNCTLTADGAGTGVIIRQYTVAKPTIRISGSNVVIQDLNFDTQASTSSFAVIDNATITYTTPISNVLIQRCRVYSSNASAFNGIEIRHCTNAVVTGCTITTPSSGIYFMSCVKSTIAYNTITGANGSITLYRITGSSLVISPQCTNCIVENNTISTDRGNSIYAISVKNCYIRGNYITSANLSNYFYGIYLNESTDGASTIYNTYVSVSKNTIDNTGWVTYYLFSMNLRYTQYCTVEGNMFTEVSKLNLVSCFSTNIVGNSFTNIYEKGIELDTLSGDIVICGNGFTDIYHTSIAYLIYINVTSGKAITITGNGLYRGSKVATSVNTFGSWVQNPVQDMTNIVVSGNSFRKNAGTAPYASSSGTVFCYYYEEPSGDRLFVSPTNNAPTSGYFFQGDKVLTSFPGAGGYIGYVCTSPGTPGTWKQYGAIQP